MKLLLVTASPNGPVWIGSTSKPVSHLDAGGTVYVFQTWTLPQPIAEAAVEIATVAITHHGAPPAEGWFAVTPKEAKRAIEYGIAVVNGQHEYPTVPSCYATINAVIDELGVPASIIAKACGVHLTSVKRWQNGTRTPDWEALVRLRILAQALGKPLTIDHILGQLKEQPSIREPAYLPLRKRKASSRGP